MSKPTKIRLDEATLALVRLSDLETRLYNVLQELGIDISIKDGDVDLYTSILDAIGVPEDTSCDYDPAVDDGGKHYFRDWAYHILSETERGAQSRIDEIRKKM